MKIKKIFLYGTTHLPEEGWFQGCIHCDTITANTRHFKTIKKPEKITAVHVFLCMPCRTVLQDDQKNKAFIEKCEIILNEYDHCDPVEPKPPDPRVVSSK